MRGSQRVAEVQALLDALACGALVLDACGCVVRANAAAAALLGLAAEQLPGQTWAALPGAGEGDEGRAPRWRWTRRALDAPSGTSLVTLVPTRDARPTPEFERLPVMMYRTRRGGWPVEYVSEGCHNVLGWHAEDLLADGGRAFRAAVPPEDRRANWSAVMAALGARRSFVINYRVTDAAGRERWVTETGHGVTGPDGRLAAIEGIISDITALKEAEARQDSLTGVRAVLAAADELVAVDNLDELCRSAVELARERLGAERCSIFLDTGDGGPLHGTWGTDMQRRTTDERTCRVPRHHHQPNPGEGFPHGRWAVVGTPPVEVVDGRDRYVSDDLTWAVVTTIRTQDRVWGTFSNDAAISGAPFDERLQRRLLLYCSLLGRLMDRLQATADLAASELRYRLLFENSLEGVVLYEILTDEAGAPTDALMVDMNRAAEVHTGLSRGQVVGRRLSALAPPNWPRYLDNIARVALTGQPWETVYTSALTDRIYYLRAYQTRPGRCAALLTDISEKLRAVEALARNEERYRLLFEHAPLAIVQFDPASRVVDANGEACRLANATRDELLGADLLGGLQPDMATAIQDALAGRVGYFEGPYRPRRTDRILRVRLIARPLHQPDGALLGGIALAEDVTAQHELEARLSQASKMEAIGRLAGGVAHDFNNLLTTIAGYTELALTGLGPEDVLRADLECIIQATQRATGLTRQLLTFSRRQHLQPRVTDVNQRVLDFALMVRPLVGDDVALSTLLTSGPATVLVDPDQLEQVLMNLVVNARDAMPEGGALVIETRRHEAAAPTGGEPGAWLEIVVRDTGCGMDEATLARIFEPFFSTKERGKGTGLGLSTSYAILRQSGGHIHVESTPGAGATFQLWLPAVTVPADQREELAAAAELGVDALGRGEAILVAEDRDDVRALVCRVLDASGYVVHSAVSGDDAIEVATALAQQGRWPVDLLLTDVVMPGINGVELAARLRASAASLRVVYMSGYTEEAPAREAATEPGAAFLQKPFAPNVLAATVRRLLDG